MTTPGTIAIPRLRAFCQDAFEWAGLSPADAATGADALATTDAWGTFTHGSKVMRGYLRRLKAGGLNPAGRPGVVSEGRPGRSWTAIPRLAWSPPCSP